LNCSRVGEKRKKSSLLSVALGLLTLATLCACSLAEDTAEDWFKKGQELDRMGSWQQAVDAYDQATILDPEYIDAWCAKCKALSNANLELSSQGEEAAIEKAILACDRAIEIDPGNAESWSAKGYVLYQEAILVSNSSILNQSLLAYEKAIELADTNASDLSEAWRGKGTVLSQIGRNEEALRAQEKAIDLNESDVEAWMGKAVSLTKLGRNEEAVQAYDRILEIYSSEEQRVFDYPYIWHSKGRALEKLGREEEANQAYNKTLEDADTIIGWLSSGREFYMNLSEAWQWKGQLLEDMGRYEEAIEALDNATEADPNSARDWSQKGFLLASQLGRYEEAIQSYNHALEIDPENAGALVGKGDVLCSLGSYQEAGQLYDKAILAIQQKNQNSYKLADAWYGKGESQRKQGRYEEALQAYDKAIEINTSHVQDAQIGRAAVLEHMGRQKEALAACNQSLADYERIAKDNPKRADIWLGLGNALAGLGRYEEAVEAYNKAIDLCPRCIDAWLNKGKSLDNLARTAYGLFDSDNFTKTIEESILAFDMVIEIAPQSWMGWYEKGYSLGLMGALNHTKFNESISSFDKAIELISANETAILAFTWIGKGTVLSLQAASTGDKSLYEDAVKAFDDGLEKNPRQTDGLVAKASALLCLGRYNESLNALDDAIEAASQDNEKAQIWFEEAHLFAEQGDYNETLNALNESTKLAPEDKDLWINGGVLLSAVLGRDDEALGYYDRALQIDPADGYAWYARGESLKALGRQAEADRAYAKAETLGYQR